MLKKIFLVFCFFVMAFWTFPVKAKDSAKTIASSDSKKSKKHFPPIRVALDSIDNWTTGEVNFYLQKISKKPKLQYSLLDYFDTKSSTTAFSKEKQISESKKKFIHELLKIQLNSSVKKSFHEDEEITAILHSFHLVHRYRFNDLFYRILPFVAYPLTEVREACYPVIKTLGTEKAFPILMSLAVSKNPIDRILVARAFEALADKRTIPYLLKSLQDKNKSVRLFSIVALGYFKDSKSFASLKRMAIHDSSIDVRIKALQTLMQVKTSSSFFASRLNDSDPRIRYEAVSALRQLKIARPIGTRLGHEKNCQVRLNMLQTLVELGTTGGQPQATQTILKNNSCNAEVSLWTLYAFQKFGSHKYSSLVTPYLFHANARVKEEAAWTLQNMPINESAKDQLKKIIFDTNENTSTRSAALYTLFFQADELEKKKLKQLALSQKKFPVVLLDILKQE